MTTTALLDIASALRRRGILGINRRNLGYVLEGNGRARFPLVDNKLRTKEICQRLGIAIPEIYAVIRCHGEVKRFPDILAGRRSFVIKPARGAGGRGVLVVADGSGEQFSCSSGRTIAIEDIRFHLSTSLSGLYSIGAEPDQVIIEQRIATHPAFEGIAVGGLPDVRVVVYRGVPVMAMLRLPTAASGGRANLHQGAVAAGIDLARGKTFGGVWRDRPITHHPDTSRPLSDRVVPSWTELLQAAVLLARELELGYVGVDFAIDQALGPVVLEANARPGLAIQITNREGLLPRLDAVDQACSRKSRHTSFSRFRT